jgi:hypothetical protein
LILAFASILAGAYNKLFGDAEQDQQLKQANTRAEIQC